MIRIHHEFEYDTNGECFGIRFSSDDVLGHEVVWSKKRLSISHLAPGDHPIFPEYTEHAPAYTYAQARQAARRILESSAKGIDE